MTAAVAAPGAIVDRGAVRRQRIIGIFYLLLAAIAAFVLTSGIAPEATSTFALKPAGSKTGLDIPNLVVPSVVTLYAVAALCGFLGAIQLVRGFGTRWAVVLGIAVAVFVFGFLTWAAVGKSMSLIGILQLTVVKALPITFGALSGLLCERAGVVNIAIEGMLLTGAFTGAVVGSATGNNIVGLVAAGFVGAALGTLLAVLAIRYRMDQIIAGTVINIFAAGITGFVSTRVLQLHRELNEPQRFPQIPIPVLSEIPIIGPMFFSGNIFLYALFVLIGLIHYGLFYTRWGLRVRAVGEHPRAADTVGINVLGTRYRNVILGGIVAGVGGAYFTLGSTGSFVQDMTAGRGFIGLAAMIFGAWTPVGAFLASLVFGFADAVQARLSILNIALPSEFLLMVPYLVTIVVVAGLVGRVRAPAADGRPYEKE
ncbi:MAG: ABC transporter permease, simple sugar transport system permease protein [Chloroflexi bacterium CSP1-4]|nr:MAG: ABC transporter permease, simple sugar transport system permease protein [Chloroflexi bacterium CSP1-4]